MTSEHSVSKKEPLVHISKRDRISFGKAWGIRIIAVLISLVVCALVIVALTKLNPLEVYRSIADGAVGTERRLWVTIRDTMILLCIAVGLTPAFKMRFWNIGAEGQILAGAAAAAAVMIYGGDSMSNGVLLVVMFLAGLAAGLVWGLIPAVFKAFLNTNETLFTLMMNYVAMQIVTFCIVFWENPEGSNTVGIINAPTQAGWLPALGEWTYGWNVIIIMAITLLMYFYLKYSKQGYEIAVVGESENTALLRRNQRKKSHHAYNGDFRSNLRNCRFRIGQRCKPYDFYQYGRRKRIYGDHRCMDVKIQYLCNDLSILLLGIYGKRSDPDRIPVQSERECIGSYHRNYFILPDRM